ncbi:MAG: FHA domain-containing protein [Pirellulales bacterium]
MLAKLLLVSGRANRRELAVKTPSLLGRSDDANLVLRHPTISRRQCEFIERDGKLVLRDLGSRNGTLLNDRPTDEATVEPGDRITIGPLVFEVQYEAAHNQVANNGAAPQPHESPLAAATAAVVPTAPEAGSDDDLGLADLNVGSLDVGDLKASDLDSSDLDAVDLDAGGLDDLDLAVAELDVAVPTADDDVVIDDVALESDAAPSESADIDLPELDDLADLALADDVAAEISAADPADATPAVATPADAEPSGESDIELASDEIAHDEPGDDELGDESVADEEVAASNAAIGRDEAIDLDDEFADLLDESVDAATDSVDPLAETMALERVVAEPDAAVDSADLSPVDVSQRDGTSPDEALAPDDDLALGDDLLLGDAVSDVDIEPSSEMIDLLRPAEAAVEAAESADLDLADIELADMDLADMDLAEIATSDVEIDEAPADLADSPPSAAVNAPDDSDAAETLELGDAVQVEEREVVDAGDFLEADALEADVDEDDLLDLVETSADDVLADGAADDDDSPENDALVESAEARRGVGDTICDPIDADDLLANSLTPPPELGDNALAENALADDVLAEADDIAVDEPSEDAADVLGFGDVDDGDVDDRDVDDDAVDLATLEDIDEPKVYEPADEEPLALGDDLAEVDDDEFADLLAEAVADDAIAAADPAEVARDELADVEAIDAGPAAAEPMAVEPEDAEFDALDFDEASSDSLDEMITSGDQMTVDGTLAEFAEPDSSAEDLNFEDLSAAPELAGEDDTDDGSGDFELPLPAAGDAIGGAAVNGSDAAGAKKSKKQKKGGRGFWPFGRKSTPPAVAASASVAAVGGSEVAIDAIVLDDAAAVDELDEAVQLDFTDAAIAPTQSAATLDDDMAVDDGLDDLDFTATDVSHEEHIDAAAGVVDFDDLDELDATVTADAPLDLDATVDAPLELDDLAGDERIAGGEELVLEEFDDDDGSEVAVDAIVLDDVEPPPISAAGLGRSSRADSSLLEDDLALEETLASGFDLDAGVDPTVAEVAEKPQKGKGGSLFGRLLGRGKKKPKDVKAKEPKAKKTKGKKDKSKAVEATSAATGQDSAPTDDADATIDMFAPTVDMPADELALDLPASKSPSPAGPSSVDLDASNPDDDAMFDFLAEEAPAKGKTNDGAKKPASGGGDKKVRDKKAGDQPADDGFDELFDDL